jgi:hypothetical protein
MSQRQALINWLIWLETGQFANMIMYTSRIVVLKALQMLARSNELQTVMKKTVCNPNSMFSYIRI